MYGNCLIYALYELLRSGGGLYIEFYPEQILPHFCVERKGKVYDCAKENDESNSFLYRIERRRFKREKYKRLMRLEKCRRKLLFRV